MDFSIADRLQLLGILPAEGNITTLRIARQLKEDLSFSEEEHKALEFKFEEGRIRWNPEAPEALGVKAIEIGPKAQEILAEPLKKLSESGKLSMAMFDLYEKVVEE